MVKLMLYPTLLKEGTCLQFEPLERTEIKYFLINAKMRAILIAIWQNMSKYLNLGFCSQFYILIK